MDYKEALLGKIKRLISGEWTVPRFRESYYWFYLDDVPKEKLTKEDDFFFGEVQEKLDWVNKDPDDESKKAGWMDYLEYIQWLKERFEQFLSTR